MALAACGGASATPSPSSLENVSPPVVEATAPVQSEVPSSAPTEPAGAYTATAICDAIGLRKTPSTSGARLKVINSGTAVHVVAAVDGTAYKAGACGTSGSGWLEIDKVGGASVQDLYGVSLVYAAAGFFQ